MSRAAARRGLSALLTLAVAAAAMLIALDRPAPTHPPAFALAAGGALTLANDRAGTAILQAGALRPGATAEGTVTLTPSAAATLRLAAQLGPEHPGTGGGRLSGRLTLTVDDVTDPARPARAYEGALAALAPARLRARRRRARRYRFRVGFPAGTGDDALQGAALTAAFTWTAVAGSAPAPSPAPARGAGSRPGPARRARRAPAAPAAAGRAARVTGLPAARRCLDRRRYALRVVPRAGVRVRSVAVRVGAGRARAVRRTRAVLVLRRAAGRVRVRVVVRTTAGTVTVQRTYRVCATG